jgi:G3E family GTPase
MREYVGNADGAERLSLYVITGFLGSGKTTLLQRLLARPALRQSAVLINEYGAASLDHRLVRHITESVRALGQGCLCCRMRDDLRDALVGLVADRKSGKIPPFENVLLETSGLADPIPILFTLVTDPTIREYFKLSKVICVADAINGAATLESTVEAQKQAVAADIIVVTKAQLAGAERTATLCTKLAALNTDAPALVIGWDENETLAHLEGALTCARTPFAVGNFDAAATHTDGIASFTLREQAPINWPRFAVWLSMLLSRHGERVLRVKGLLRTARSTAPLVIQGVQHLLSPPVHLAAWPEGIQGSEIVFITRDLDPAQVEASFNAFMSS